jgi:hypothetical protein
LIFLAQPWCGWLTNQILVLLWSSPGGTEETPQKCVRRTDDLAETQTRQHPKDKYTSSTCDYCTNHVSHLNTEVAAQAYAKSSLASCLVTLENHKLPSGSKVIRELFILFIPPSVFWNEKFYFTYKLN